ncbi:hypothetical protein, partial [Kribbia dieselivorans]|uniref:hypothetical protein n=1 Tax=Kribbia dieselivorans TaxID=331526 RepID=UPI0012ED14ED
MEITTGAQNITARMAADLYDRATHLDRLHAQTLHLRGRVARSALLEWRSPAGSAFIAAAGEQVVALGQLGETYARYGLALRRAGDVVAERGALAEAMANEAAVVWWGAARGVLARVPTAGVTPGDWW